MDITKIIVELTRNNIISYYVDTRDGKREVYNENTIQVAIVHLMNYNRPIYHEKAAGNETIVYSFA